MNHLRHRDLRYLAVATMTTSPSAIWTVAELARRIEHRLGAPPDPRTAKRVSDALRSPLRQRWIVRIARGCYRIDRLPDTAARRARRWAHGIDVGMSRADRSRYANWRPLTGT